MQLNDDTKPAQADFNSKAISTLYGNVGMLSGREVVSGPFKDSERPGCYFILFIYFFFGLQRSETVKSSNYSNE